MKTFLTLLFTLATGALAGAQTTGTTMRNSSALLSLPAGQTSSTIGFDVSTPTGQTPAYELIRAVGPSLSTYGVPNPVAKPRIKVFNAAGQLISVPYETSSTPNWPQVFAVAGAFPLIGNPLIGNGGETPFNSYWVMPLPDGTYTVQASDDSGKGGTVLVEVYLIPASLYPAGLSI